MTQGSERHSAMAGSCSEKAAEEWMQFAQRRNFIDCTRSLGYKI